MEVKKTNNNKEQQKIERQSTEHKSMKAEVCEEKVIHK